ncbi:MAG: polyprenyl synthetase family protein [Fimbriimonadaceae bacterium]|nr:polyprenyl synthetase family protein [Fimbriimonadaceae bacterium]QYK57933.1 MAG: polyprenyl synthetase family protein [Fimbriimonadaceae bacterium]
MLVDSRLRAYRDLVESRLDELLPSPTAVPARLHEAMRYAVLGGGKRLRPLLVLASAEAAGGAPSDAVDAACAVECVHAFSLVHDDLPALDDDDLRRGRPTLHKAFDEALAILAGDALFALAFQIVAGSSPDSAKVAGSLKILAGAVGSEGLVGGEVLDLENERQGPDPWVVKTIHERKTGALIGACCGLGAVMAGASREEVDRLLRVGKMLGLAFQIVDDLLNETSNLADIGKPAGSDRERGKQTYPAAFGVEAARSESERLLELALSEIRETLGDATALEEVARSCVVRNF